MGPCTHILKCVTDRGQATLGTYWDVSAHFKEVSQYNT